MMRKASAAVLEQHVGWLDEHVSRLLIEGVPDADIAITFSHEGGTTILVKGVPHVSQGVVTTASIIDDDGTPGPRAGQIAFGVTPNKKNIFVVMKDTEGERMAECQIAPSDWDGIVAQVASMRSQ
jgi:hypothetical protein